MSVELCNLAGKRGRVKQFVRAILAFRHPFRSTDSPCLVLTCAQNEYTFLKFGVLLTNPASTMTTKSPDEGEKPSTRLPGTVEKIIKPAHPSLPEKAQIAVEGADDLYREIRIDNVLTQEDGTEVSLKPGAQVEVTIEADPEHTVEKKD
jgi:hypothetical protein